MKIDADYLSVGTISGDMITAGISPIVSDHRTLEEELYEKILAKFSHAPLVKHQCASCGAVLEIDADNHIFVCKYCGSVYAINTQMVNDIG